jgi:hypothetical protein
LEHPAAVETLQQLKQSAGDDILAAADEKLSLLKKEIKILN